MASKTKLDDHAIARLAHAGAGEICKCAPQRYQESPQEEFAIPALQPEFVVVDDNDGLEHIFCMRARNLEISIQRL